MGDVVNFEEIEREGSGQIDKPKEPKRIVKRKSLTNDSTPREFWEDDQKGTYGIGETNPFTDIEEPDGRGTDLTGELSEGEISTQCFP